MSRTDGWAQWLRGDSSAAAAELRRRVDEHLRPIRDRILDAAEVGPGVTVLDVGCGLGLVGLGALERGADVVFSDLSEECLDACRAAAGDRARYHRASATDLGDVEADVVTTRSVLMHVDDRQRAFEEFFRVLRPGGRVSSFEPIARFGFEETQKTLGFSDVTGIEEPVARLALIDDEPRLQTLLSFDERDLFAFAERAGFTEIHMTLDVELTSEAPWVTRDWEAFTNAPSLPSLPTFAEEMAEKLTPEEIERVTAKLRPQLERGEGRSRAALCYLLARKAEA